MSKRVKIKKDGVSHVVTASMIRTNKVGGGTCDWLPVDETATKSKTITDNGTYNAEDDGVYGYDEVKLKGLYTTNTFLEWTFTKNGTYKASDFGYCGFSKVTVNVP